MLCLCTFFTASIFHNHATTTHHQLSYKTCSFCRTRAPPPNSTIVLVLPLAIVLSFMKTHSCTAFLLVSSPKNIYIVMPTSFHFTSRKKGKPVMEGGVSEHNKQRSFFLHKSPSSQEKKLQL